MNLWLLRVDDASQMLVFNEVYDDDPPRLEIYSSIKALGRNLNIKYRLFHNLRLRCLKLLDNVLRVFPGQRNISERVS